MTMQGSQQGSQNWTRVTQILGAVMLSWSLGIGPGLAGDPFRSSNPQPIGPETEAAFNAVFQAGNYAEAATHLEQAEKQEAEEPMVYALLASLAYLDQDWATLNSYASQTRQAAESLAKTNPLRGHLYLAIGYFMEGAYALSTQGSTQGAITALGKLQEVYGELDQAKKINPQDPELNLVQGFMDLQIAVNLPFANPSASIEQLEKYAEPSYLADWGIALAYRDLKQYDKAIDYVNRALANTQEHPQLFYLRAQILREQGNAKKDSGLNVKAQTDFRRALAKSSQMPKPLVAQIFREYCRNQIQIDQKERDCGALRRPILDAPDRWGPETLPEL